MSIAEVRDVIKAYGAKERYYGVFQKDSEIFIPTKGYVYIGIDQCLGRMKVTPNLSDSFDIGPFEKIEPGVYNLKELERLTIIKRKHTYFFESNWKSRTHENFIKDLKKKTKGKAKS